MVDRDHLEILAQGVEGWNEWRNDYPIIEPNLSGAKLSGAKLVGVNFSGANLSGANFTGADLSYTNLSDANLVAIRLSRADLTKANLSDVNLSGSDLIDANLSGANLGGASLRHADVFYANLNRASLRGANLSDAHFGRADLSHADLGSANLSRADLIATKLYNADLMSSNLKSADLSGADLGSANLSRADLSRANLTDARLIATRLNRANLSGTELNRTDLSQADLSDTNLSEAKLIDVNFNGTKISGAMLSRTILVDVDLRNVEGLDDAKHYGPSILSPGTLSLSEGRVSEVFLRGCGLSSWEMAVSNLYNPELTAGQVIDLTYKIIEARINPYIQFYSCFISYSSKDEGFTRLLYSDLQSSGVHCWFAPEDMKVGDRLRHRIDESILLQDKLLLILSETSVTSQWIEQEVETALEKEREEGREVLFPVRLDDTVMNMRSGWPALIKKTRHIGDFRHWDDADDYKKAFARLLRALRVGA